MTEESTVTPTQYTRYDLAAIERGLAEMEEDARKLDSADAKVSAYSNYKTVKDNLVMRHLLLIFRGKEMSKHRTRIGQQLSSLLVRKIGVLEFIHSTCDLDQSVEDKTSFDQRFRALSTVITGMPALCCSLEDYYESLSNQLFKILIMPYDHSVKGFRWRLATHICSSLYIHNETLGHEKLIKPILDAITGRQVSILTCSAALLCIHRLILSDFDKYLFIPVFPNLLAILITLNFTVSPHKGVAKEIVIDMLQYVDQSTYMLDEALTSHLKVIHLYKTGLVEAYDKQTLTVITVDDGDDNQAKDSTIDLKTIDRSVQTILSVLKRLDREYCLHFFLLLLEKIHQKSTTINQLLLFSLVDSLQEKVSRSILNYPSLAIEFIVNTLRRITADDNKSIQSLMKQENVDIDEEEEIESNSKILHNDSLSMVIQIVSILMEAKNKLTTDEISSIKGCQVHLERALTRSDLTKSEKDKIEQITRKINNLSETPGQPPIDPVYYKYTEAVRCLNSEFMPQRAHGLVVLRNLIDSRYEYTIVDRNQLFTLISACLSDSDSYVYLAAVNALASMALAHTDECLPVLIDAYHDKTRSVRERVSVGESLVWVCKYLGQMAHNYYRLVVDCFLNGLKDEDESIRVSSLSNLGQFCSSLKNSLTYCITEIISAVECLLKTDTCYDVKRACLMFLHIMLNGLDSDSIGVIIDHLKTIYHLIKSIDSKILGDDLIRVHVHLTLEAIDYHMKNLLQPSDDLIRPIKL